MGLALSSSAGQIHVLGGTSFQTTTTTTLRKSTSRNVVFLGQRLYSNGLISLSKSSSRETNHGLVRAVHEKVVRIDSELLGVDLRAVNEKVDLGKTNSAVAALGEDGKPTIITTIEGERTTPSVVAKTPSLLNIRSKKRTRRKLGLKGINIPTKRVPSGGGENAKSGRRRRGRRSQSLGKREAGMAGAINFQEKDDDSKTAILKNVMRKSEVAGVVRPTTPTTGR